MSVFYRDIDVKISDDKSELSKPLIVYERDRGLEIYFNLKEYAYKYDKKPLNLLENLVGAYATVTLVNPSGDEIRVNEVEITEEAKVKFVITKDLTDELTEIGIYQLQIHVNNDVEGKDTSAFSVPPFNFEVRERLKGKKNQLLDSEGNGLIDKEGYQLMSASTNRVINFPANKINEYLGSIPTMQGKINGLNSQLNNITTNHLDVNIRDFGAKCDGITDDTEAIKKAIKKIKDSNTKSSLNLTYGTILISENIVIPSLLKVYGQGIYKTTIKAKEGVSVVLDATTDGIYNNEFYDFTIDGGNISNIKGIDFDDINGTINDENCKFENILIVNCKDPLIIGNNNRGNRFDKINIEHCVNGLVVNGTDNIFKSIIASSIENNGIEINGSNNHLSMCKVFYADKVGCVVNGNINVIDIEVQENGLNGIEINGFLNNVNILADTNGRISPSHNIKIDGYKNLINGVCSFNSSLNGNIDTHINILKGVINELNIICHGDKPYLAEGCISPSNKIVINNKSLIKNIAEEGMVFEHFGTGTSSESYNYFYNAPSFYNINTQINQGGYYKKEISISGNKKYSSYLKALVRGGACKMTLSFYNSDSLISEVNSEELNNYHNQDSVVFLNGDFPLNANKVVFNIKTYATANDGYSESVILDYGFTMF